MSFFQEGVTITNVVINTSAIVFTVNSFYPDLP